MKKNVAENESVKTKSIENGVKHKSVIQGEKVTFDIDSNSKTNGMRLTRRPVLLRGDEFVPRPRNVPKGTRSWQNRTRPS